MACIFHFKKRSEKKALVFKFIRYYFSSLFAIILGVSGILFVPDYWEPKFQTIQLLKDLYLENILFTFFLGGVVATFYQVLFKKKLTVKKINPVITLITPFLFLSYFFNPFKQNVMVYAYLSMFIGGSIAMFYLGKRFSKQALLSSLINTLFSLFWFILWYTFPELPASYQFSNLSGILIFGVPLEEFLWISSFSLYWTPLYDIWKSYFKK